MVKFLRAEARRLSLRPARAAVLDLGCGNGALLRAARRRAGFRGRCLGVDYSARSVELARRIEGAPEDDDDDESEDEDGDTGSSGGRGEEDGRRVEFQVWDVLRSPLSEIGGEGAWDVVLDKGTFDAVSLSEERDAACAAYKDRVLALLRPGGCFLVTSCNWTEDELRRWFRGGGGPDEGAGAGLDVVGRIDYPSFSFGGVKGQTISTLCFMKQTA